MSGIAASATIAPTALAVIFIASPNFCETIGESLFAQAVWRGRLADVPKSRGGFWYTSTATHYELLVAGMLIMPADGNGIPLNHDELVTLDVRRLRAGHKVTQGRAAIEVPRAARSTG